MGVEGYIRRRIWGVLTRLNRNRWLSDEWLGFSEYYLLSDDRAPWRGAFNGQVGRAAIFEAVLAKVQPALIVETGTFLGATTELFAKTGLPVVSVEGNERHYGFSTARLRRWRNVELRLGDSRKEAAQALAAYKRRLGDRPLFAYLDAHWHEDLPLAEELDVIFSVCPGAVAMVDDFRVPDDPGYGYDDYGLSKKLDHTYILPAVEAYGLAELYPALSSVGESGLRRGCVVLAKETQWAAVLLATNLLRRA